MKTITAIEKEAIRDLKFCKREVLFNPEDRKKRYANLMRGQALGNLVRSKVKITFETADENLYQVDTTIWATGQEFVALKCGINIPINAIHEVS
ncbi:hypothetical protein [Pararhodonellum marinum]|uniref:hypothetical protein n=1 Tax=Pararhodonellum marinum TaxID=2755358 RepID=UPI00188EC3EB|nr:hypothetical protein [Pararhodonellum marinum]